MTRVESNKISEHHSVVTLLKLFIICLITFSIFVIVQYYEFQPSKCTWRKLRANQEIKLCPIRPPNLVGSYDPDVAGESLESVEDRLKSVIKRGGHYKPPDCVARDRVAVIIPCRGKDRERHIPVLMKNLHPMMVRQQLDYQIFIVFQTPGYRFNKGAILNAGFLEAMKVRRWDCIVFHDVDLIAMDDRNIYDCPRVNPRHLAVDVDKFDYKLLAESFFGGVTVFTPAQYQNVNGHSNLFWGWGGEDTNLYNRVMNAGYLIERPAHILTRYKSLEHEGAPVNPDWQKTVKNGTQFFVVDGLNSIKYHIKEVEQKNTYTRILVYLKPEELGIRSEKVEIDITLN